MKKILFMSLFIYNTSNSMKKDTNNNEAKEYGIEKFQELLELYTVTMEESHKLSNLTINSIMKTQEKLKTETMKFINIDYDLSIKFFSHGLLKSILDTFYEYTEEFNKKIPNYLEFKKNCVDKYKIIENLIMKLYKYKIIEEITKNINSKITNINEHKEFLIFFQEELHNSIKNINEINNEYKEI